MRKVALRAHAVLPRQYDHRKVQATTVDAWGRALWLVRLDAEPEPNGHGRPSVPPPIRPYDAVLVIGEAGATREQVLYDVSLRVYHLDALPNGRFLLEGLAPGGEKSAQIYGRDGRRRSSFESGRAIGFVMADRRHHLWTAYGDEGVYSDPIAYSGLVRWDSGGNRRWCYSAPKGVQYIDTVYALNVEDGSAWASYYPTFPLLEARTDGQIKVRTTPVASPRGIAVRGDEVVMLGGNRQGDHLHLCRLAETEAVLVEEACLTLPNGTPLKRYSRPVGRGRHLYLHGTTPRQWYVLAI